MKGICNLRKHKFVVVGKFLKDPLLWSSTFNVITVNLFAVYYSLKLGPERRSYLATIFTISLILHTLFLQAPGLRLRSLPPNGNLAARSLKVLFLGSLFSIPAFLLVLAGYSFAKQPIPVPLFVVGLVYFLGSVLIFTTQEILYHHRKYKRLIINDLLSAFTLIISSLLFSLFDFSLIVNVLLSYFSSFILITLINISLLLKTAVTMKPLLWLGKKYDEIFNQRGHRFFFQITIFSNLLERGDKVILAFLLNPTLFAKFTFNIAPLVLLRFLPQLFTKLTLSRRYDERLTQRNIIGLFFIYLGFGFGLSIIIGQVLRVLQGGLWFIGFAPLFIFVLYETLRIVYSYLVARDISGQLMEIHSRVSRIGVLIFPAQFILCLILVPNNLSSAYFISALLLALAIIWLFFQEKRLLNVPSFS
jgi:hypothetical protein